MMQQLIELFAEWGMWAILFSILINATINLIGFIPSVFVTGANVVVWGPWLGGIVSWLGEVVGSSAAFLLYRFGIQKVKVQKHQHWKWVKKINALSPVRQVIALILARVVPMVPSGLVNLVGAITSVSFFAFLISSAIGKIPSIALEVLVSYDLLHFNENYVRLILCLVVLLIGFIFFRRKAVE